MKTLVIILIVFLLIAIFGKEPKWLRIGNGWTRNPKYKEKNKK